MVFVRQNMLLIYDVIYSLGFILYLPVLLVKGKLHWGFKQRFSFFSDDLEYRFSQKPNIWFHAVSVGEIVAIVGLVEKIRRSYPGHQIVISTVTPTGYALAHKRFQSEDIIVFAPLDLGWVVRRFIKLIRPEIFILTETEIWPNLLAALAKVDVPMVMINGRISDRSFYRYCRFQSLLKNILRPFRAFCMQSTLDADRIISLGALSKNVTVLGSMKFDDVTFGESLAPAQLGFSDDALIWVAGSTHPGEERVILDVFKKLKIKFPSLSLVIVPRHIERAQEISALIEESGLSAVSFRPESRINAVSDAVVVVDTIGYLKSLYRLAAVVFVGKSLVGIGGQNIIEPAFFAKPIIVGPNMQNFADIIEIFLQARAIVQISQAHELAEALDKVLSSAEWRASLGQRALATVKKNQGATSATEKIISQILATTYFSRPV